MDKEASLINGGDHMYYKNIAKNIIRQNKLEETKKNQEDKFTEEFNFKPHFLKTENDNYSNIKSRLYQDSTPKYKYSEEIEVFKINKINKPLEIRREEDIKKMTERLYSEQKKFKEKREKLSKTQIKEECPFMPNINVPGKADPKYFMMRLEKWNKKIEEKNKENMERRNNLGGLGIGKEKNKLFQPVVRDPIAKKLKRENEVHIDLYNKGLDHINYRKSIMTTDIREDLTQIENKKKERIKSLKEERDRYKREKKEKEEKEINERTLRAKAEKENLDRIIKERSEKIYNEKEKRELELKQKYSVKKSEKEVIGSKDNKNFDRENNNITQKKIETNSDKNENEKNTFKEILKKENKIKNSPPKEKETKKEKESKVEKTLKKEEKSFKNNEKNARNKSKPQKSNNKAGVLKKDKEKKTTITTKENKGKDAKDKKIGNKEDNKYSKKLKNAKNNIKNLLNKDGIIGELEFNNMKSDKKTNNNYHNTNEYNVVSVGSKTRKINKEKKSKK